MAVAVPSNSGASKRDADEQFKANVQDIFFDYDSYDVRSDAQARSPSRRLPQAHPDIKVLIGGYCDERGSNEYNLTLGQNRADSAKERAGDRPASRPTACA
jgi:peptidoglycan-associated lipoprotein